MVKQKKDMHSQTTEDYMVRSLHNRFGTFSNATMMMIGYFIALDLSGDDDETKQANAQIKVDQISKELFSNDSFALGYIMGSTSCRIEFFNKINAISEVTYTFFDQAAKDFLINELTPTV